MARFTAISSEIATVRQYASNLNCYPLRVLISTHFVHASSTSSQVSCLTRFFPFDKNWGLHLALSFIKNASESDFKKATLQYENQAPWTCPGAPRESASRANKQQ